MSKWIKYNIKPFVVVDQNVTFRLLSNQICSIAEEEEKEDEILIKFYTLSYSEFNT